MRCGVFMVAILLLGVAACGGEEASERQPAEAAATTTETTPAEADDAPDEQAGVTAGKPTSGADAGMARRPAGAEGLRVAARRARIVARESRFGRVLFDANGQVVYAFENDRPNRSNCTSEECVEAWPPVLTREQPSGGAGVVARLLGTIRRSDGRLQVTYNGRPLYFYEHEAPGEIKCHNVELHGGLWWVVTPRGDPAA